MPKFDAGALASQLEFDFTAAGVDAKGVIPEPSDKMIGQYLDDIVESFQKLAKLGDLASLDPTQPEALAAAMQAINGKEFIAALDEVAKAAAKLCGGTPSLSQIRALPLRVRQHFFAYLQREVVNPEAGPGAGTPGT